MRPKGSAIAICLLCAAAAARADVSGLLGPRTLAALRASGRLTRSASGSGDLRYLPRVDAGESVRLGVGAIEPTVVVELLALAALPGRAMDLGQDRLAVSNALRSVSRLEGLRYFSASHGDMRLLYRSSYRIASPEARVRLPDPLVSSLVPRQEIWVYQDDTTFGGNVYSVSYVDEPGSVLMRVANQTAFRYLLLNLVPPGGTVLYLLVVPDGEEILFYAAAAVRLSARWARPGAVEQSFRYRVEAMERWFTDLLRSS